MSALDTRDCAGGVRQEGGIRRFRDSGQGVLVATAEQLTCSSMAVAAANGGCLLIDPALSAPILDHLQGFRHIRIYAENLSVQRKLGAFTPKIARSTTPNPRVSPVLPLAP